MKMHTLKELISINSKCIFHNANENAFAQQHAKTWTQNLYLHWLTSQTGWCLGGDMRESKG